MPASSRGNRGAAVYRLGGDQREELLQRVQRRQHLGGDGRQCVAVGPGVALHDVAQQLGGDHQRRALVAADAGGTRGRFQQAHQVAAGAMFQFDGAAPGALQPVLSIGVTEIR